MSSNRGRMAFGLAAAAVGWALLLIAAAFFFPAYQGESCSGTGGCTSSTATDFAMNGWLAPGLLAGVAAVAAIGFYSLHVVCSRGSDLAAKAATWCAVVLGAFAIVSAASIGLLVLPVALLLLASAMLTPQARPSK